MWRIQNIYSYRFWWGEPVGRRFSHGTGSDWSSAPYIQPAKDLASWLSTGGQRTPVNVFFIFLPLFLQSFMLKIYKVNRIKVCTYRSSYFQQKTLLLKCSISGPTFNFFYFVTSHYINKLYICIIYSWQLVWHVRNDSAQLLCGCERRFRCDALTKQELKQSFSDRGLQPWIVGNQTLTLTHQTIYIYSSSDPK